MEILDRTLSWMPFLHWPIFSIGPELLYGAWVIYYASRRSIAFFHPQMRNICLVAFAFTGISACACVFFVLDISKPDLAGWGDTCDGLEQLQQCRCVEWVERIEALEREDKKDGCAWTGGIWMVMRC